MKPIRWAAGTATLVLGLAGCATNRDSGPREDVRAEDPRVAELQRALVEKDRRIEALERKIAELGEARPGRPTWFDRVTGSIEGPASVYAGETIPYRVTVENHGDASAQAVDLWVEIPAGLELVDASGGEWNVETRTIRWGFASLAAGEKQSLLVTVLSPGTGEFRPCVHFSHRLTGCAATAVYQPALACRVDGPAEALVGATFPAMLSVTNTGSGVARDVVGTVSGSPGLTFTGVTAGVVRFGDIPAGQTVERRVDVVGTQAGPFHIQLDVLGAPSLACQASHDGVLVYPDLEIVKTGDAVKYTGQEIRYAIRVTSTGTTVARGVVVTDPIPLGTQVVSISEPGQRVGSAVEWRLGDLAPGQSVEMGLALVADRGGVVVNCARVAAAGVAMKESCAETRILEAAGMHLSCVDSDDPVEVGGETLYTIEVENQGRIATTRIAIEVALPPEAEFVSAQCPLAGATFDAANHRVIFEPLAEMGPKAMVAYQVRVRFVRGGSVVTAAFLSYAEFSRPVRDEEGTTVYE